MGMVAVRSNRELIQHEMWPPEVSLFTHQARHLTDFSSAILRAEGHTSELCRSCSKVEMFEQ